MLRKFRFLDFASLGQVAHNAIAPIRFCPRYHVLRYCFALRKIRKKRPLNLAATRLGEEVLSQGFYPAPFCYITYFEFFEKYFNFYLNYQPNVVIFIIFNLMVDFKTQILV